MKIPWSFRATPATLPRTWPSRPIPLVPRQRNAFTPPNHRSDATELADCFEDAMPQKSGRTAGTFRGPRSRHRTATKRSAMALPTVRPTPLASSGDPEFVDFAVVGSRRRCVVASRRCCGRNAMRHG